MISSSKMLSHSSIPSVAAISIGESNAMNKGVALLEYKTSLDANALLLLLLLLRCLRHHRHFERDIWMTTMFEVSLNSLLTIWYLAFASLFFGRTPALTKSKYACFLRNPWLGAQYSNPWVSTSSRFFDIRSRRFGSRLFRYCLTAPR